MTSRFQVSKTAGDPLGPSESGISNTPSITISDTQPDAEDENGDVQVAKNGTFCQSISSLTLLMSNQQCHIFFRLVLQIY